MYINDQCTCTLVSCESMTIDSILLDFVWICRYKYKEISLTANIANTQHNAATRFTYTFHQLIVMPITDRQ